MIATDAYELLKRDAGLIERPGRAVIELQGGEAAEFLQGQVTNDVEALEVGEGCYAALLDHKGKLRTDMRVLRVAGDRLSVDAESIARRVLTHNFETYSLGRDVRTRDLTDERLVVSLIGPASRDRLDAAPPERENACLESHGTLSVTTDLGVDLIVPADEVDAARALAEPVDEEVGECLRIESGRPRLGRDMDASTMPQEAGINERAVSFTKGCYVGQETVARLFYRGKPNRHLRGLRLAEPCSTGETIRLGEKEVGVLGSACESPAFGPIALALVRREASPGDEVAVGEITATVVELPFA